MTITFEASALDTYVDTSANIGNKTNASTQKNAQGQVQFENDSYLITAGDDSTVTIQNKKTGEKYHVWGDPHVQVYDSAGNACSNFDFYGATTMVLDDGTKVTIDTEAVDGDGSGATYAGMVTITNGDYGVQIRGVAHDTQGDLMFNEFTTLGRLLDRTTRDGNVLHEADGKDHTGFVQHLDGNTTAVDQAAINSTDWRKNPNLVKAFDEFVNNNKERRDSTTSDGDDAVKQLYDKLITGRGDADAATDIFEAGEQDIETLVMAVLSERSRKLEEMIKSQVQEMRMAQKDVESLNSQINDLRTLNEKVPLADREKDQGYQDRNTEIEKLKTKVDSIMNVGQMFQIRLQALNNRYNETSTMLTTMLDKYGQTRGQIAGHIGG